MTPRLERVVRQVLDDRFSSSADLAAAIVAAVLGELQLTEEQATRPVLAYDDPAAPKRTNLIAGPDLVWATHFEFMPSTRLVSEWEPRMEHADSMRPWAEEQR